MKDRSRYTLNDGVFTEPFFGGKTWFEYRLLREQGLDAEFGRYKFHGQRPLLFPVSELPEPLGTRIYPEKDPIILSFDSYPQIMSAYKRTLEKICNPGDKHSVYGETAKADVANVLALNERILIGADVAASKIDKEQGILYLEEDVLRDKLRNLQREKEVIAKGIGIANRYVIENPGAIGDLFRDIIEITLDLEVAYVKEARRIRDSQPRTPVGWGQIAPSKTDSRFSAASKGFASQ